MNNLLNNEYITYCLIKTFDSLGTLFLFSFLSFGIVQLAQGDYCNQQILNNLHHPCSYMITCP